MAHLIAGKPRNTQLNGETNVYIDDFEGAQTNIDIKGFNSWKLSSVPFKNFKGSEINDYDLKSGFGRAKIAWYSIDPIFYAGGRPSGINNDDVSLNTTRRIFIKEIFPEQDLVQGTTTVQNTLDLAYYPQEKVLTTIQQMKSKEIKIDEKAELCVQLIPLILSSPTSSLLNFGYWIHSVNWKLKKMI